MSKKPEYCTQNNGDCATCSLTNYGLNCANIPVNKKPMQARKDAFEQFAIEQGVHSGPQTLAELHNLRKEHKGSRWITIVELFIARGQAMGYKDLAVDTDNDWSQCRAMLKKVLDSLGVPPAHQACNLPDPYGEIHRAERYLDSLNQAQPTDNTGTQVLTKDEIIHLCIQHQHDIYNDMAGVNWHKLLRCAESLGYRPHLKPSGQPEFIKIN